MNTKQRLQRLEGAKPKTQVIKNWREFIQADEETIKQYDAHAKANGGATWEEFIKKAEQRTVKNGNE